MYRRSAREDFALPAAPPQFPEAARAAAARRGGGKTPAPFDAAARSGILRVLVEEGIVPGAARIARHIE